MIQTILEDIIEIVGQVPPLVHVTSDSREVVQGSFFVAITGIKQNGQLFIEDAIRHGASTIITEETFDISQSKKIYPSICFIIVKDSHEALSCLTAHFYGSPSRKISVIGVTGTNGKTTTHWMIADLFSQLGKKCGRIGTLGLFGSKDSDRESLTTPDPKVIHHFLNELLENKNEYVSMEVSSHALDQKRVSSVHFDLGIFSNLTRDHLDYHGSIENYACAKQELFRLVGSSHGKKIAIINLDSSWGEQFACAAKKYGCKVIGFAQTGFHPSSELSKSLSSLLLYTISSFSITGTQFHFNNNASLVFKSPYIGEYNVENLVSAILAVSQYGFSFEQIADVIPAMRQVPGRLERVSIESTTERGPWAYVDYAHTPDALEKALEALKPFAQRKLIALFGCGGDRDKGKRPLMFDAAKKVATDVVVTSDNPRTEDPTHIIRDITAEGRLPLFSEVQRAEAIRTTLSLADEGDIVLIAGKGHEDYQILGTEKVYFSDQNEVRNFYR
jgi:UDP-N-acetylmuramoyl-L-alanyl-D-glutamate--2,6-diaminopimelate ligase